MDVLMYRTLRLIDRLCVCFAQTSNDEDNPAARYSRQIKALQLKLSSLATNVSKITSFFLSYTDV